MFSLGFWFRFGLLFWFSVCSLCLHIKRYLTIPTIFQVCCPCKNAFFFKFAHWPRASRHLFRDLLPAFLQSLTTVTDAEQTSETPTASPATTDDGTHTTDMSTSSVCSVTIARLHNVQQRNLQTRYVLLMPCVVSETMCCGFYFASFGIHCECR